MRIVAALATLVKHLLPRRCQANPGYTGARPGQLRTAQLTGAGCYSAASQP